MSHLQQSVLRISIAEQNAAVTIQKIFRGKAGREKGLIMRQEKEQVERKRLHLEAIWQILLTGFEVIMYIPSLVHHGKSLLSIVYYYGVIQVVKFPAKGRCRKRVMWLTLDGKLCVGQAKKEKYTNKYLYLRLFSITNDHV